MPSRIRSLTLAALLAPVSLACSAGGGDGGGTVEGPPGGTGLAGTGNPGLGSSLVPTLPLDPSNNLGVMGNEPDSECDSILAVTYRDFNETHPDFERTDFRGDTVRLQLVQPNIGPDNKPVFRSSIGCQMNTQNRTTCTQGYTPRESAIISADTFNQWFRTTQGVNIEFSKTLELTDDGSSHYVFDSNQFFPLSPTEGFGVTPANGDNGGRQNFLFTTEIHVAFTYTGNQQFTFRGDDDLWIFVNGKLALDLGSMHAREEGTINFDAQAAALGITPGSVYPMDIFQAERHTTGSNFRFETNITCFVPQIVR